MLGTKSSDWDGRLENIVDAKLLRRGWGACTGALKKEADFSPIRRGAKAYIQVAKNAEDPNTFKRVIDLWMNIKASLR